MKTEDVICVDCGTVIQVVAGALTEDGRKKFKCEACLQQVLENRIQEKSSPRKKLLVEG